MSRQSKSAIPLVLPNDCTWDAETGTYDKKEGVERETLNAVPKALDQLKEIKGPVCVVSIAGPCRGGKSYILSKAFDQGEVFPLGHLMDPETMGIWLWVVPQKFKDSTGRDFTVVLLDSEGVDSVYAKQADDHRIFTLSVLLSSILMYNSAGVPKRGDLESLDFIVKLSQRIQLRSTQKDPKDKDESHFHEAFPFFIWLLRDVVLSLPKGYSSFKDYFVDRVFSAKSKESSEEDKKIAESILGYFSGFDAFSLPPPSCDPEVVQDLTNKESQANPQFFKQINFFKEKLHSKLAPKRSIDEGGFVTGEALASMVQLFVEALNTPGTVPNVENTWDAFVHNKCTEVLAAAIAVYKQEMTSQVKDKIPCDADVIRELHEKAQERSLNLFREETLNLSSATVEKYLNDLVGKIGNFHSSWLAQNEQETDKHCTDLIRRLKKSILDKVFIRLRGPEGSSMDFTEIMGARDEMEKAYFEEARGDHNIRAVVFVRFNEDFKEEMNRNVDFLQKLKDYDADIALQKAENAALEQQRILAEEQNKRLEEERKSRQEELQILMDKFEADKKLLEKTIEDNKEIHNMQTENLRSAFMLEMAKEREARNAERMEDLRQQARDREQDLKQQLENERRMTEIVKTALEEEKEKRQNTQTALTEERKNKQDAQTAFENEKRRRENTQTALTEERKKMQDAQTALNNEVQWRKNTQAALQEERKKTQDAKNRSRWQNFKGVFTGN